MAARDQGSRGRQQRRRREHAPRRPARKRRKRGKRNVGSSRQRRSGQGQARHGQTRNGGRCCLCHRRPVAYRVDPYTGAVMPAGGYCQPCYERELVLSHRQWRPLQDGLPEASLPVADKYRRKL